MRFRGLDLNLLVALDALLRERNVTRASERIHIGQPGMSSALLRLRSFFDDELLVQVGRTMVPTPLALSLISPLQATLSLINDQILSRPTFDPKTASRNFVFLISDYVKFMLMPTFLSNVQTQAPHVTFELSSISGRPSLELDRCSADVVILPDALTLADHPKECLYDDRFVVIGRTGNEALANGLSLDLYLTLGHVLPRFGPGQSRGVEELHFQRFGEMRKAEVIVQDFGIIPELVAASSRIATVPLRMARLAAARHPISIFELPFDMPITKAMMQWNAGKAADPGTQWMLQMLRDSVAEVFSDLDTSQYEPASFPETGRTWGQQLH